MLEMSLEKYGRLFFLYRTDGTNICTSRRYYRETTLHSKDIQHRQQEPVEQKSSVYIKCSPNSTYTDV